MKKIYFNPTKSEYLVDTLYHTATITFSDDYNTKKIVYNPKDLTLVSFYNQMRSKNGACTTQFATFKDNLPENLYEEKIILLDNQTTYKQKFTSLQHIHFSDVSNETSIVGQQQMSFDEIIKNIDLTKAIQNNHLQEMKILFSIP